MSGGILKSLEWQGNSYAMYKAVIGAVPGIFRGSVRRQISGWVVKNKIQIITEDLVFKAVDDIAPEDLARKRIKPELEKLRSRPE